MENLVARMFAVLAGSSLIVLKDPETKGGSLHLAKGIARTQLSWTVEQLIETLAKNGVRGARLGCWTPNYFSISCQNAEVYINNK